MLEDPSRYSEVLREQKTGDEALDTFIDELADAMDFFTTVNPYTPNPLKPYLDKADTFLRKYAGIGYRQFLQRTNPKTLKGDDFDLAAKTGLKKKLFQERAELYLAALDSCDKAGINIAELVTKIRKVRILPIKKDEIEPVFEKIIEALERTSLSA